MARRKKRRRYEAAYYVVGIERWEWDYSFGVNESSKHFPGAYSEYRHLQIFGSIIRPAKITADSAELTFLPSKDYEEPQRERHTPIHVGTLSINSRLLSGLFSMPMDALPLMLQLLTGDRLKYITMIGDPMFRRQASIRNYRLHLNFNPDEDLPDDT